MKLADILIIIGFIVIALLLIGLIIFLIYLLLFDRNQKSHSILRNYPALGRIRYFFEKNWSRNASVLVQ